MCPARGNHEHGGRCARCAALPDNRREVAFLTASTDDAPHDFYFLLTAEETDLLVQVCVPPLSVVCRSIKNLMLKPAQFLP
jgi:hypothetical protein